MCVDFKFWVEDLEIVRRCSELIVWKCSIDLYGMWWLKLGVKEFVFCDYWWVYDVCLLSIDLFSKVIYGLIVKGLN